MPGLSETDWTVLLSRIRSGKCTPFLGAGAAYGYIPLGAQVARDWAREHEYPLAETGDLPKVAQFVASKYSDQLYPKEQFARLIANCPKPDFTEKNEPHAVLARLPLPLYMTTNYDTYMHEAVKQCRTKLVERDLCGWNSLARDKVAVLKDGAYVPTVERPLVYHLHGHADVTESMVLTEDDFLDFLVSFARDPDLLPSVIQERMGGSSLLFLGYSLNDFNFRVLFRSLVGYLQNNVRRGQFSVQLEPNRDNSSAEQLEKVRAYLSKYFRDIDVRVYWGTCREFMEELKARLD